MQVNHDMNANEQAFGQQVPLMQLQAQRLGVSHRLLNSSSAVESLPRAVEVKLSG